MLVEFAFTHWLLATASEGRLAVTDLATGQTLWTQAQIGEITHLSFSPDGQLLAGAIRDGLVRLWRARQGTAWYSFPVAYPVTQLRWSQTQQMLACAGTGQITTWTVPQAA